LRNRPDLSRRTFRGALARQAYKEFIMIKMTHLLLAGAVALALSDVGLAQDTPSMPLPLPDAPAAGDGEAILQALHQPRIPASLFAPSPPPSSGFMPVDSPYFVRDPLLDSSQFPPPGWFAGAELQVLKPHLINRLSNTVQNPVQKASGTSTTVALPSAPLDWAVSPRVFLGYRLPSGFGEFAVTYRHLGTMGSEGVRGANGPATLNSRLAFDMIDFDYSSRELSLWPKCDMKWTFGLRVLTLFFDSRADQPFAQAAAGSGIFQAREYNNLVGLGPHAALELVRHLGASGWALCLNTDFSSEFNWSHQGFFTRSTTLGPAGRPLAGESFVFFHQGTSIVNVQAGVTWQPSRSSATRLFLGYQYERWFALEGVVDSGSHGQLWDQGVVLQATIHF
jgi:hypothetical protein